MKKDKNSFRQGVEKYDKGKLENGTVLENFTIYAHKFDGFDGWIEYSDMK